jgi:sec-independent protein translocase protein TatC
MSPATPQSNPSAASDRPAFDPDACRMSLGEHLEELRGRLVLALAGYLVLLVAAFFFGDTVVGWFCLPLIRVLAERGVNTQVVADEAGEGFAVFLRISMISAAVAAAPWVAYQGWRFVAAGLYPHERRHVNRLVPLSLTLLVSGMLFVYFLILPWTLGFLVGFNNDFPLPRGFADTSPVPALAPPGATNGPTVPVVDGNPPQAAPGSMWYDARMKRLKFFVNGQVGVIAVQGNNLVATEIKLSTYVELVIASLLIFGISFQLPLAVVAAERIGVAPLSSLRSARRYVYFALAVAAAVITPGGDVTAMLGLTAPLIALYELGIRLASLKPRATAARTGPRERAPIAGEMRVHHRDTGGTEANS